MDMALLLVPSHDTYFVGVLIGVAPDVATSSESHVNGRGTTIGVQPRYQVLNQGVAPIVATSTESHAGGHDSIIGAPPLYSFYVRFAK